MICTPNIKYKDISFIFSKFYDLSVTKIYNKYKKYEI